MNPQSLTYDLKHPDQAPVFESGLLKFGSDHFQKLYLKGGERDENHYVKNDKEVKVEVGTERIIQNNHIFHFHCRTHL